MHPQDNPALQLEGAANFRDLGGYPTASGAMIRRGRIFRSDAMHRLTANDVSALKEFAVVTLIDLRAETEVARTVASPLIATGVRHRNIPVFDIDALPEDPAQGTLVGMYESILRNCGPAYREIFHVLADPQTCPAIIHCAAGKDRTGIASALILGALGASNETIVADYAITDTNIARATELWLAESGQTALPPMPEHLIRALPETMTMFLEVIATGWGSIPGYLNRIGVTDTELARFSAAMLETGQPS